MEPVETSESNTVANPHSPILGSFDSATVAATLQGGLIIKIFYIGRQVIELFSFARSWRD